MRSIFGKFFARYGNCDNHAVQVLELSVDLQGSKQRAKKRTPFMGALCGPHADQALVGRPVGVARTMPVWAAQPWDYARTILCVCA